MSDILVDSHVLVNNKHKAIVRYIGETKFADGVWYGLELEREIGKHEGTVLGVTYFTAPKKRGTFVRRENLTPYNPELEAAGKMQAFARMANAKKKAKTEVAWRAFNTLDADEENQNLQRRQRLLNSALGQRLNRDRPDSLTLEQWEREAVAIPVEQGYDGPHLTFPLTEEQVVAMVDAFKQGRTLHPRYAAQLIGAYRRYTNELPTLVDVSIAPGTRLTVCGDTHGQLQDLFSIFTINGMPSPTNRYLMNGDFVDRGEYSCEILFTLFAFALLYPGETGTSKGGACLLNRGNHESSNQNVTGGFMMEVLDKYSGAGSGDSDAERGLRMYDLFQSTFDTMPLSHLIHGPGDRRVFVVHGGMMQRPGVTLSHIAAIKRKREIPYGLPGFEDKLFEDLMWSDPRPAPGTVPSDRGAGVFFGGDVTERFCATNGISLVVRSHECVPEGFMFHHDNRLLTVFSASRYCGRGTNRGAFVVFEPDLSHSIQQFVAGSLSTTAPTKRAPSGTAAETAAALEAATKGKAATAGEATPAATPTPGGAAPAVLPTASTAVTPVGDAALASTAADAETAQVEAIRRMLVERIVLHKGDLYFYWSAQDRTGSQDGCITRLQWADGMRTVLSLDLPWLTLAPQLVDSEPDGKINYTRFLDRYRIAMRDTDAAWMEGIVERACEKLFSACASLEAAFAHFDTDKSGVIEYEELERGLNRINIGLSRSQVYELMQSIDTDKDGRIQFSEFSSRFKLVFSRLQSRRPPSGGKTAASPGKGAAAPAAASGAVSAGDMDPWVAGAIERVGAALFKGGFGANAPDVFAAIDTNKDGTLSPEEFQRALTSLNLGFSNDQIAKILAAVDTDGSGNINYLEFIQAFRVTDVAAGGGAGAIALTYPSDVPASAAGKSLGEGSSGGSGAAVRRRGSIDKKAAAAAAAPAAAASSGGGSGSSAAPASGPGSHSWQRGVIEQIVSTLYEYRVELAAAFRMFDLDGNGVISADEFRQGLQALTGLTGSPITDMQAEEMMRALDVNGDGSINYDEFVGAFRLVDTQ